MYNLESLNVNLPDDIRKLKEWGDFEGVLKLIDRRLKNQLPRILSERLEMEKEIIRVLRRQYTYSLESALSRVREQIPDFTEQELVDLKDEGFIDWIYVEGKVYFQNRFLDTLIKTNPDFASRTKEKTDNKIAELLEHSMKEMKERGSLGYRFRIKSTLQVKDEAFEPDHTLKVYLPIPKETMQIDHIDILAAEPRSTFVSPLESSSRTVYFEETSSENRVFSVEYSFENRVRYVDLDARAVKGYQPSFHIDEQAPHIVFTPYIKALTKELSGYEMNLLKLARRFYDYVTTKVAYTYMREYLAIENIVEYGALNLKGDCGVQALLFITLCRCAGIPARWQSGLFITPSEAHNHDWAQFYVEPFGWLYADCSFGGSAYRKGDMERWEFYFGNVDPFRMVASSEFQCAFQPEMQHLRMDPYDNQSGECEYKEHSISSDMVVTTKEVIDVKKI